MGLERVVTVAAGGEGLIWRACDCDFVQGVACVNKWRSEVEDGGEPRGHIERTAADDGCKTRDTSLHMN